VAFAPANGWLASAGGDGTLCLWEVPSGKLLHSLPAHGGAPVSCVAFAPDGTLASGGFDGLVKLWDAGKGRELATLTPEADKDKKPDRPTPISGLAFSRDSASLALGVGDPLWDTGKIEIWDVARRERKNRWTGPNRLRGLALADNGLVITAGTQERLGPGLVELREADTGKADKVIRSWQFYAITGLGMLSLAVTPDGKILAAGSGHPVGTEPSGQVILADAATGKPLPGPPLLPAGITSVALSKDGRLAVADFEGVIRLYELNPR
jgi:WD40 repeat protein